VTVTAQQAISTISTSERGKRRATGDGFSWPRLGMIAAVFVVGLWLFPVYWIVLTSLKPIKEINSATPSFIFAPTGENYWELFTKFDFARVLMNSLVITFVSCFVVIVLAVLAAYALGRMKVPGEKHIALWILSLRFLPPIAVAIPFYIQWQDLHLLDTYLGMILIYVAFNLPFAIWMMRGFLADVPVALEEAALLDGLTRLQIIRRIVVPVVMPGIASTAIFTFVFTWNEYLMALMLTAFKSVTVPVTIAKFVQPYTVLWGSLSAAVVIQVVPMLVVVFLLQRHIVRGMTLGAVK
jgi:multiple sugar transport system permease protein